MTNYKRKGSRGERALDKPKTSEKWTEKEAIAFATEMKDWFIENKSKVFMEEWISEVVDKTTYRGKIHKDTLNYLSNRFESVEDISKDIALMSLTRLKNRGLDGTANANVCKFLLSAQFGLREKTEVINTNLNVPILNIDPLATEDDDDNNEEILND
jgi:hypothetical protein